MTHLGHLPPEKVTGLTLTCESCRAQASAIGPATASLVETLLDHRPEDRLRSAGRLLRLARQTSPTRLEQYCARAQAYGSADYPSVKRILAAGLEHLERPPQEAGWPDVGLVLAVESWVRWPCHLDRPVRHELRSFLSSLPAITPPDEVLQRVRLHWHSENRLHWPRDVTLGEDACQVRSGPAPQALAAVRNAALGLLHQHHLPNAAAVIRTCAWSPPAALFSLLGLSPP
jgi:hypothetical protein